MLAPTIRKSLLALIAGAMLLPSGAFAARRPVSRNAPAPVEETKPEAAEKKEEAAEAKKDEMAGKKDDKAGEKQAEGKPADAKPDEKKAADAAAAEEAPAEPPKPQVVVPVDERGVKKQEKAADAVPPPPAVETVYRKRLDNKTTVTLRVRPAQPEPGKLTTFLFEFSRILEIPDPVIGDRAPVENADFVLTLTGNGKGAKPVRYRLNPLRDAGIYGTHFTTTEPGLYTLEVEQRLGEKKEIGEVAITGEFQVGIGVPTPPPSEEEEQPGQRTRRGRGRTGALKAISERDSAADVVGEVMGQLGTGWNELARKVEDPKATPEELAAIAKTLSELAGKVEGQVPVAQAMHGKEFNLYAGQLNDALKDLVTQLSDRNKVKASLVKVEQGVCLKCHTRFRYQITEDVSSWPKFEPKDVRKNARR